MKCLVVNAYANQAKGKPRFQEFLGILRPILAHYDKTAKVIVRDYTQLAEFVFANDVPGPTGADGAESRKAGLKAFDTLDFVFIDGDEELLPWLPEAASLFSLTRLAFQTGKCMFTTIQGTMTVCYANALGGERLNVVNGRGQRLDEIQRTDTADPMLRQLFDSVDTDGGGDLDRDEIVEVVKLLYSKRGLSRSKKQVELEVDDIMDEFDDGGGSIDFEEFTAMVEGMPSFKGAGVSNSLESSHFIELASGDVYRFRAATKEFKPYKNIGMRRKMPRGRGGAAPMSSFLGDCVAAKKIKYNNHFCFGQIGSQSWKVYTELSWDVSLDQQPTGNGLSVLADSDKGLLILESGNTLGIRFFVQKRCPESIAVLDSFVRTKSTQMMEGEYIGLSAQHAYADDLHPLQLHYKPSKMHTVKPSSRPISAAPKQREAIECAPLRAHEPQSNWISQVTEPVKALGTVTSEEPECFGPKCQIASKAKPSRPSTAATSRRSTVGSRLNSATSRRTSATSRPVGSATSRQTVDASGSCRIARAGSATSRKTVTSTGGGARNTFRAAQREVGRGRQRPMSAVSLGGVSIMEDTSEWDEEGDTIVDEDRTETSGDSNWRHPSSVLSSRMGPSVRQVVWCNNTADLKGKKFCNFRKYQALTARDGQSRNVSVTNVGVYDTDVERRQRAHKEGKKRWLGKKDVDTSQTTERYKSTATRSRAAWGEYKNCLHEGEWVPPVSSFRDSDKTQHIDDSEFQTAVRKESDLQKDIAYQWVGDEEVEQEWGEGSLVCG